MQSKTKTPRKTTKTATKPPKPTKSQDAVIEETVTSRTGELLHLNYLLSAFLASLQEDMQSNSLSPETVAACASASLEMVNLSTSMSVLLKIWESTSLGCAMTTDEQVQLTRLFLDDRLVVDQTLYHFE